MLTVDRTPLAVADVCSECVGTHARHSVQPQRRRRRHLRMSVAVVISSSSVAPALSAPRAPASTPPCTHVHISHVRRLVGCTRPTHSLRVQTHVPVDVGIWCPVAYSRKCLAGKPICLNPRSRSHTWLPSRLSSRWDVSGPCRSTSRTTSSKD
jgi:hypothetical protein